MTAMKKEKDNFLKVVVNQSGFEYDIHSLVKAFYPAFDVKVLAEPDSAQNRGGEEYDAGAERKDQRKNMEPPTLRILFTRERVLAAVEPGFGKEPPAPEQDVPDIKERDVPDTKEWEENRREGQAELLEKSAALSEDMPRSEVKNRLKQTIYGVLSEYTGKCLPWGSLTGIRPTRIAMMMLEEGKGEDEILDTLSRVYLVSDEKGKLALDIAQREKALLDTIHYEDGYSLYIGIPFCPTTCLYCSFTSYPIVSWKKRVGEYLDALEKEIDAAAAISREKVLDSIYIGGGTPTTLEPEELQRLLAKIRASLDLSHLKEFTVEAGRPDSITPEKLKALKEGGVTRISVNPQTMNQETLDFIGRRHTVEQVKEAFAMARDAGFTNINMDIILGLPGEKAGHVCRTMEEIEKLEPDSLTVHSLAIKRASKLSQWIAENGIRALNNTDEMMQIAAKGAERMGMLPYYLYRQKNMSGNFENVGYAREGKYGIYNILMMEEKQTIVACGAGSVSKRVYPDGRIERSENVKDVSQYIERIGEMIERKKHLLCDC